MYDVYELSGISSKNTLVGVWLENLYWISFVMSFMGIPFVLFVLYGFQSNNPDYLPVVIAFTEIALIGSIYFPFCFITKYIRNEYLRKSQWTSALGSIVCVPIFAFWLATLDSSLISVPVLVISMVGAPILAYLIAYAKFK